MDAKERMTAGGVASILLVVGGAIALGVWGQAGALASYTTVATVAIPMLAAICGAHTWGQTRTDQAAATAAPDEPKAGA